MGNSAQSFCAAAKRANKSASRRLTDRYRRAIDIDGFGAHLYLVPHVGRV
jgi:hypothetical protein